MVEQLSRCDKLTQWSKSIEQFSQVMREKLSENLHKSGWHDSSTAYLIGRLKEELVELEESLIKLDAENNEVNRWESSLECADVANFAMMIADNLTREPLNETK